MKKWSTTWAKASRLSTLIPEWKGITSYTSPSPSWREQTTLSSNDKPASSWKSSQTDHALVTPTTPYKNQPKYTNNWKSTWKTTTVVPPLKSKWKADSKSSTWQSSTHQPKHKITLPKKKQVWRKGGKDAKWSTKSTSPWTTSKWKNTWKTTKTVPTLNPVWQKATTTPKWSITWKKSKGVKEIPNKTTGSTSKWKEGKWISTSAPTQKWKNVPPKPTSLSNSHPTPKWQKAKPLKWGKSNDEEINPNSPDQKGNWKQSGKWSKWSTTSTPVELSPSHPDFSPFGNLAPLQQHFDEINNENIKQDKLLDALNFIEKNHQPRLGGIELRFLCLANLRYPLKIYIMCAVH